MKLDEADIKKYPKFAQYVRHQIPLLKTNKSIIYNLKTNGSLDEKQIQNALTWGNEPRIVVTDLSSGQCKVPAAYGCTRNTNLTQIEVDQTTVQQFEDSPYKLGTGQTASKANVFIVGVTILHELCHLGNFKKSVKEKSEAGEAFEKGAYGKVVP